ncbi:hypothetical protein VTI74DRAFT_5012 [Chaetomium olivicolor]
MHPGSQCRGEIFSAGLGWACRSNVHCRIANLTHTTIAVRDIPPNTELTISYLYGLTPHSERQSHLSDWGFTCTCAQCSLSATEISASDTRIRQIKQLEEEIESIMSRAGAEGLRPELGGRLVELYWEEKLDAHLALAHTRAALIYTMFGMEERAREYAVEAVGALEGGRLSSDPLCEVVSMVNGWTGCSLSPLKKWRD